MQYRPEIDGLRAVAIIPVILFHAGFSFVPGGYIGVDVFFVISGYLITSLILQDLANERFSFHRFFVRRIGRIAPALMLVAIVCVPFAWLWMYPDELRAFGKMLASTSLFLSNVTLWGEAGYFEEASELNPLLHTWSLAIEEQFYLIFPGLLILSHRLWRFGLKVWLPIAIGLGFALADWMSVRYPDAAYFLIPTRAWQLMVGAWVAIYTRPVVNVISSRGIGEILAGLGLLMIGIGIFYFNDKTPFPGRYALLPTLGAAFVIVGSASHNHVGRLLASAPLVHVGLISYAMYVWHQPVLAFSRLRPVGELDSMKMLVLCGLIYLLAWFTWRFVEQPARLWTNSMAPDDRRHRCRVYVAFLAMSALIFGIGAFLYKSSDLIARQRFPAGLLASLKPVVPMGGCFDSSVNRSDQVPFCTIGDLKAPRNFILVGDSHALVLKDVFNDAAKALGHGGLFTGLSGCPPMLGVQVLDRPSTGLQCHEQNERVFDFIKREKLSRIFLVARWTYYTDGGYLGKEIAYIGLDPNDHRSLDHSRNAFKVGLAETERRYREIGVEVIWIMQIPQQKEQPRALYSGAAQVRRLEDVYLRSTSVSLNEHKLLQSFVVKTFGTEVPSSRLAFFDDWLCDDEFCTVGTANLSRYSDDDHLSREGALLLSEPIRSLLTRPFAR